MKEDFADIEDGVAQSKKYLRQFIIQYFDQNPQRPMLVPC